MYRNAEKHNVSHGPPLFSAGRVKASISVEYLNKIREINKCLSCSHSDKCWVCVGTATYTSWRQKTNYEGKYPFWRFRYVTILYLKKNSAETLQAFVGACHIISEWPPLSHKRRVVDRFFVSVIGT